VWQLFESAVDEQDKALIPDCIAGRKQNGPGESADASSAERCRLKATRIEQHKVAAGPVGIRCISKAQPCTHCRKGATEFITVVVSSSHKKLVSVVRPRRKPLSHPLDFGDGGNAQ
jgi:hypothetical protein